MQWQTILLEQRNGVGLITLNRPQALNALNNQLIVEVNQALDQLEKGPEIGCIVITGSEKAFAAGADIKEMADLNFPQIYLDDFFSLADRIAQRRKPLIAAVSGYALGGGCELAQHADIIIAARTARFGQPEVNVGIMPGGGATQRLVRAMGYWRAMHLMLAGEPISADEAMAMGLVSEVVDDERLDERAVVLASLIASRPPIAVRLIKQVALAGADSSLAAGLLLERRAFESLFDTQDQKEGMRAFAERRAPVFIGQ